MDLRPTRNAVPDLKIGNPLGLSNGAPLAALLLSHRSRWLYSFVAACQRIAVTQRSTFDL